jgi:hypothetical protein
MLAKTPNRTPNLPKVDEEARKWFDTFLRSQVDCLAKQGNLREALLVMADLLQEKLSSAECSFYRRTMPWAGPMEMAMRGISVALERPHDFHYIRSTVETGSTRLINWTKQEEENPSDPLRHPLAYVDVGTHVDLIALCDEIEQKVQPLNESVIQLMIQHFKPFEQPTTLEVHTYTFEELGLEEGGEYGDVMEVANEFGLDVLPIDAPLHLLMRPLHLFGTDPYVLVTEKVGSSLSIFNGEKGLDLKVNHDRMFGPKTRLILQRKFC